MNKKLIYIFAVLVAGLFIISSCKQTVGRKVDQNVEKNVGDVDKSKALGAGIVVGSSCSCGSNIGSCEQTTTTIVIRREDGTISGEKSVTVCNSKASNPCSGTCLTHDAFILDATSGTYF